MKIGHSALKLLALLIVPAAMALADECVVPNEGGTAAFPPPCPEGWMGPMIIDEGIDGGSIEIDARIKEFTGVVENPGGSLGGRQQTFDAQIEMHMAGTGSLDGFARTVWMYVAGETHTAPRTPGDAVQDFDTDFYALQGTLFGDPDFDLITVTGGTDFGLPSPGHATLTRLGPPGSEFAVDSFFDICYRIEFVGAPGSVLQEMSGVTQRCERFQMGEGALAAQAGDWTLVKTLY